MKAVAELTHLFAASAYVSMVGGCGSVPSSLFQNFLTVPSGSWRRYAICLQRGRWDTGIGLNAIEKESISNQPAKNE
jgi:hypothetical protein